MKSEVRNSKIENRRIQTEGNGSAASLLAPGLPEPVFHDKKHGIKIYQGDCLEILAAIPEGCIDLILPTRRIFSRTTESPATRAAW